MRTFQRMSPNLLPHLLKVGVSISLCIGLLGLLAPLQGLAASPAASPDRCVVVVGTNDVHGAIEPQAVTVGSHTIPSGGVMGLSGYISILRQKYGSRLILLDAGDIYQGSLASNLSLGKAMIAAYNVLGYDASAVGNHEFDFGPSAQSKDPNQAEDRLGVIKQRMSEAHFPFLAVNIFEKKPQARVRWPYAQPSILREFDGIKVGILGVSTLKTPYVTHPRNVTTLEFRDPVPLIRKEARALRRRGADMVILVGHVGGRCTDLTNPADASSCAHIPQYTELREILEALPKGTLDVAVGGHTHHFMGHWIRGTATLESGTRAQHMGWVEACLKPQGGLDPQKSTIHAATPLCLQTWEDGTCSKNGSGTSPRTASFLGQPVKIMPELQTAMQPYLDQVSYKTSQTIGAHLPDGMSRSMLGDTVAEAIRNQIHADFGLYNRGGVRTPLAPGMVTYGQVFQALPFESPVVQVNLTGAQIETLVKILSRPPQGTPPHIAGLRVERTGDRVRVLTAQGQPLRKKRIYRLSTNDFVVAGGDETQKVFKNVGLKQIQMTDATIRDTVIERLATIYPAQHSHS